MSEALVAQPVVVTLSAFLHLCVAALPHRNNFSDDSSKLGLQDPNTENERNHRMVKDVNLQASLNETVYSQTLPAFPNSKTAFPNFHSGRNRANGKQNDMESSGSHKQTEEFYEKTSSNNSWIYLLHDDSTSQKLDLDTTTDIQGKFTETTSKPDKVEITTHNVNTDKTTPVRSHTTKTITVKPNTTEVAVHQANIENTTIAPPGTTKIIPSGPQTSKVTIQQMKNQAETTTQPIDIATKQEFVPLATSTSVPKYFQGNLNKSEIRSVLQASNSTSSPSSIPTTTAVTLQEAPSSFILTESSTFDSSTSRPASSPMSLTHYHTKELVADESAPYEFNISSLLENLQTKENSTNSSTIESLGRSFFWPPIPLTLQSQLQHPFSLKRYLKNIISDTSVTGNTLLPINSVTEPITNSFSASSTSADISNSATGSTGNFETSVTHIPYIFRYPYPAVGSQGSRQIYKNGTFSEQNFKLRFPQKSHQNNYVADQWGFSHAKESHHHPHGPEVDVGTAHEGYSMNSLSKILQSMNYQSSGLLFPYAAHLAPGYTTSYDLHPTKSVAIPSVVTTRLILSTRLPNDDGDEPFFTLISHSNKQKSHSSEILGLSQLRSPPNLVSSGHTRPKLASLLHEDGIKKYYSDSLSESNLVTETINSEIKKFQSILISAAHNVLPQNFTRIEVLSYLVNLMKLAVSGTNSTRRKQGPTSIDVLPAIPSVTGPASSEALNLSAMPLVTEPASIEVLDLPPIPSVTGPANIETLDLSAISSVTEPTSIAVLDIPAVPLVTEQVSLPLKALSSLSTLLDASPDTVVTLIHTVTVTPDTYNSITTITPKLSTTEVTAVTEKTFSTDVSSITRVLTETWSSVAYLHDHLKQPQTVPLRENLSTQKKEGSFHRFSEVTTVTIVKPLWQELTESISEYTTNNARPQITAISHLTPTPSFHTPEANQSNKDEANESLHYFSIDSDPPKSRTWIYSSKTSDGASWNRTESFQASVNMILGNKDMVSIMPSYIDKNVLPEMAETDYRVVNVLVKIEATSSSPTPQITISDRPSSPLQRFQLPSNHVHMSSPKITNKGGLNSRLFNGSTSILSLHHAASPMQSFHFISHTSYDKLQTPGVGKWNILIPFTLSHKPQFIQHSKVPASENTFIKASHMMHHTNTVSEESPVQTSDTYSLTKRLAASTGSQLSPIWNPGTIQNHHKTTTKAIKVNSSIWPSSTPSTTVFPEVLTHLKKHSVIEENQEDEKLVGTAQPSPESAYHKTYNTQEQLKQTQQELNHAQQNFDNNEKEKYLWPTEKHTGHSQTLHQPEQKHLQQGEYPEEQTHHSQDQSKQKEILLQRHNQSYHTLHRPDQPQFQSHHIHYKPEQTRYVAHQTQYWPDHTHLQRDQANHRPYQTQNWSYQKQHPQNQTQYQPHETQNRPAQPHPQQIQRRPGQTQDQIRKTQHRPYQTHQKPHQTQHRPHQAQHEPERTHNQPDQTLYRRNQTQQEPKQTQHQPHLRPQWPDQKQHKPDKIHDRPNKTQHRPEKTQYKPIQTQYRPDQTEHQPFQTQNKPDQPQYLLSQTQHWMDQAQHPPNQTQHQSQQTQHQLHQTMKQENQTLQRLDQMQQRPNLTQQPNYTNDHQIKHHEDHGYHLQIHSNNGDQNANGTHIQTSSSVYKAPSTLHHPNSSLSHASTLKPTVLVNSRPELLEKPNTTSTNLFPDPSSFSQLLIQLTGRPLKSWIPFSAAIIPTTSRPHPFTSRPHEILRPSSQKSEMNTSMEQRIQSQFFTWSSVQPSHLSSFSQHHTGSRPLMLVQRPTHGYAKKTKNSFQTPSPFFTSHKPSDIIMASHFQSEAFEATFGHHYSKPFFASPLHFLTTATHKVRPNPSVTSLVRYSLNVKQHTNQQASQIPSIPASIPYLQSSNSASEYWHHSHKYSSEYNDIASDVTDSQIKIRSTLPESIHTTATLTRPTGRPLPSPQRLVTERNSEKVNMHPQITSTVYFPTQGDVSVTVFPSFASIESDMSFTPSATVTTAVNRTATVFSHNNSAFPLRSYTALSKLSSSFSHSPEFVSEVVLPPVTIPPFRPRPADSVGSANHTSDTADKQVNRKCSQTQSILHLKHHVISQVTNNASSSSAFPELPTATQTLLPSQLTTIHPQGNPHSTLHDLIPANKVPFQIQVHRVKDASKSIGFEEESSIISPSKYPLHLQAVTRHTLILSEKDVETLKRKYYTLKENDDSSESFQVIEKFQNFLDGLSSTSPPRDVQILINQKLASFSGPHITSTDVGVQKLKYQRETQTPSVSSLFFHQYELTSNINDKVSPSTTLNTGTSLSTLPVQFSSSKPLVAPPTLSSHLVTHPLTTEQVVPVSFPYATSTLAPIKQDDSINFYSLFRLYSTPGSATNLSPAGKLPVTPSMIDLMQSSISVPSQGSEDSTLQKYAVTSFPQQASTDFNHAYEQNAPSLFNVRPPFPAKHHILVSTHPTYYPHSLPGTPSAFYTRPSLADRRYPVPAVSTSTRPIVTTPSTFLRPRVPVPTTNTGLLPHLTFGSFETSLRNPVTRVHSCGALGVAWRSVFLSPSYPRLDRGRGRCVFRLLVASLSVCQVRVDIVDAALVSPKKGRCEEQRLEVSGNIVAPAVTQYCGADTGQHFYVHLAEPLGTSDRWVVFSVTTSTDAHSYRYQLRITQVDCSAESPLQAPSGCLQYFPRATGVIKSFNYDGGQYMGGHEYRACVRAQPGACTITLAAEQGYFGVDQPWGRAGVGVRVCTKDYLFLPSVSMDVSGAAGDGGQRFCGGRMSYLQGDTVNRPVTAHLMGPVYVVTFRSSDPEQRPTTSLGLGFMLTFRQRHSCTDFSLSSPPDPALSDVETEWPAGWSLDALLPDGHEIEMLSRNASIFPPYPLPTTVHSHVDVFPSPPFTSIGNHHAMNFYKREGLVKENNETIDGKYSKEQDQQKPIQQQQQQQPESKNVKEAERNDEGAGNGAASTSPFGAGHSLSRVSNILSATLTQVFPEFGHSLQDLLERRNAPSQADQQEV